MTDYFTPGVYVEEVQTGTRPITAVGTSTAGFIGLAPSHAALLGKVQYITNWAQFKKLYFPTDAPPEEVQLEQVAAKQALQRAYARTDLLTQLAPVVARCGSAVDAIIPQRTAAIESLKAQKASLEAEKQADLQKQIEAIQKQIDILTGIKKQITSIKKNYPAIDQAETQADAIVTQGTAAITGLQAQQSPAVPVPQAVQKQIDDIKKQVDALTPIQKQIKALDDDETQAKKDLKDKRNTVKTNLEAQLKATTDESAKADLQRRLDAVDRAIQRAELQAQLADPTKTNKDDINKEITEIDQAQQAAADEKQRADQAALKQDPDLPWTPLAHAVYGFFNNGGSACYVVNVGANAAGQPAGYTAVCDALSKLDLVDEIAILAAPGYTGLDIYQAITDSCARLHDRVGILDGPETVDDSTLAQMRGEPASGGGGASNWEMPQGSKGGYVTLYSPWLLIANPNPATYDAVPRIKVPPSGHIAGIWARSDAARGVYKAPANEPVSGALELEYAFSHEEQKLLNDRGVNLIRKFPGEGILVWGARTLLSDPLWRYLSIRRLFNQIEESIAEGTRWIVFEPNDRPLWQAIKRDVTAFLMGFWRAGALMGRTPKEAFFVKCDEENNPFDRIVKGEVHIDIGLAPVRPAEFVIFRVSQYEAGTEVKASGE